MNLTFFRTQTNNLIDWANGDLYIIFICKISLYINNQVPFDY